MLNFYLFSHLHLNFKICLFMFLLHSLLHNSRDRFSFLLLCWIIFFFFWWSLVTSFCAKKTLQYLPSVNFQSLLTLLMTSFLKTCLPLSLVALCFQCLPPNDHFTVEFVGDISFIHIPKTALLILFLIITSPWVTALTLMALVIIHINKLSVEAAHNNG